MTDGSLKGIRILDLTQMLAGPYATMMLADHGAEVIKIEPPHGDMSRDTGPWFPGDTQRTHGGYFQSINRNKKSVVLDLKSEAGRDAFKVLVKEADIVAESFRHGVMEGLGLGYEGLAEINPRLVYAALRGFGDARTGASPHASWPAFDVVAQGVGGVIAITGPDAATPTKVGPGVGDIVPGMQLAFGMLAAVLHARTTGEGQFVDVAMADGVLAMCERIVYQHAISGDVPDPEGNRHPFLAPFGVFPAKDGQVTIAVIAQPMFARLCDRLGLAHLKTDPRFATQDLRGENRDALVSLFSEATARHTKDELQALLGGEVPFGKVQDAAEIAADPHFAAREMLVPVDQPGGTRLTVAGVPVKMTRTPGRVTHRAPYLGEHTEEILTAAGIDPAAAVPSK